MNQRAAMIAKLILLAVAVGLFTVGINGCQTVKGLGEDIKNAGEAGEDAIDGN